MSKKAGPIAVVEDDPAMRKALGRLLSVLGNRVYLFDSAESLLGDEAAIDALCIVSDIDLGAKSGLDLACELRERGLNVPFVFITGSESEAAKEQALALGCVAYIRKPFIDAGLMDAVAKGMLEASRRGPRDAPSDREAA
jgi:FixJ family two-component response regulator